MEKKTTQQEKLEMVFAAVDKLKQDLNKATQITKEGKVLSMISAGYAITWAIVNKKLVRHVYGENESLMPADELYSHFFPEAGSILYRIGLNGGEQIRGYIFLMNIKKEAK